MRNSQLVNHLVKEYKNTFTKKRFAAFSTSLNPNQLLTEPLLLKGKVLRFQVTCKNNRSIARFCFVGLQFVHLLARIFQVSIFLQETCKRSVFLKTICTILARIVFFSKLGWSEKTFKVIITRHSITQIRPRWERLTTPFKAEKAQSLIKNLKMVFRFFFQNFQCDIKYSKW